MKMNVLLVGGYDMARTLSLSLLKKKYHVTSIQADYGDCQRFAQIHGVTVIHGDGSKPYILEEAGARYMDIAIALTDKDDDNLVIAELCKKRYSVPKTVSVIKNAENTELFRKMGVDAVVCATNTISGIIEQMAFLNEMATVVPLNDGRLRIAEVRITATAPAAGKKLWEINLPKEVIVGCVLRKNQNIVPRGDTRVLEGDLLVLLSSANQETAAIRELTGR